MAYLGIIHIFTIALVTFLLLGLILGPKLESERWQLALLICAISLVTLVGAFQLTQLLK